MKRALRNTLLAALLMPTALLAAERNDLSSCYDRSGLSEFKGPASGRQLVVVVDQTIPMPQDIQRAAWDKIGRFVQPGDQVKLYTFSAFVPGEYMRLITDVTLDTAPAADQRDAMSMSKLRKLDTCLKGQNKAFVAGVGGLFVKALREAKSDLPKSEIMHALRVVGEDMRQQPAKERVLFLISDMLEHSDYTSFYASDKISNLNVDKELKLAGDKHLFADLDQARVYVTGAGLVTDKVKHAYRSGKTMGLINDFWKNYFASSNANLMAFGAPSLNVDLH